jgi:spermidine synthase
MRGIYSIAAISGMLVMVVEMVGSRLLAPYLGTSIYVWTSIIGVILACLSVGYWYGGKLADRTQGGLHILERILLVAAVCSAPILPLSVLAGLATNAMIDMRISAVLTSIFLFGPLTFTLGMVPPYLAKMLFAYHPNSAQAIGTLYALSTVGSIAGTLLGGFILVSYFKTSQIFIAVSCVLIALWLWVRIRRIRALSIHEGAAVLSILIIVSTATPMPMRAIVEIDTPYERWFVIDRSYAGKEVRGLVNNTAGVQSLIDRNNPTTLVVPYLKAFDAAITTIATPTRTLLIGAGAYTYPAHAAATYPSMAMDIVEIDSALIDIAQKYFAYQKADTHRAIMRDGRQHIADTAAGVYDAIFLDVFASDLSIPHHLTTIETTELLRDRLSTTGVIAVNLIGAASGQNAVFTKALFATYQETFSDVRLYRMNPDTPLGQIQNIILLAFPSPTTLAREEHLDAAFSTWERVPTVQLQAITAPILTDDFAPIEKYIAGYFTEITKR